MRHPLSSDTHTNYISSNRSHDVCSSRRFSFMDALSSATHYSNSYLFRMQKHKDKIVIALSGLGLLIVTASTIYQYTLQTKDGTYVICASGGHAANQSISSY